MRYTLLFAFLMNLHLYTYSQDEMNTDQDSSNFVLVELFTSQGCSSCPPADELLIKLANEPKYKDKIIPLGFHVDYWDDLGWKDPFSNNHWTKRQQRYGRMFQSNRIYTPQMIVDGKYQWVGSAEEKVRFMWDTALNEDDEAGIDLNIHFDNEDQNKLQLSINSELNNEVIKEGIELFIALYENGFETHVKRGENMERILHDDYVVRKLYREPLNFEDSNSINKTLELELNENWDHSKMGAVAFLQRFGTRTILGVDKTSFTTK